MKKLTIMISALFALALLTVPVTAKAEKGELSKATLKSVCLWALNSGLSGSEQVTSMCGTVNVSLTQKPEGSTGIFLSVETLAQNAMDKLKELWEKYMGLNIDDLNEKRNAIGNKLWEDSNLQHDIEYLEYILDYIADVEEHYGLPNIKKQMEDRLRELAGTDIAGLEAQISNLQNDVSKYEAEANEVEGKDPEYAAKLRQEAEAARNQINTLQQTINEAMENAREAAKKDETYQALQAEANWIAEQVGIGSGYAGGAAEVTAQINSLSEQQAALAEERVVMEQNLANLQAEYDRLGNEINTIYQESGVANLEQAAYDTVVAYENAGFCQGEEECFGLIRQELGIDTPQEEEEEEESEITK